MIFTNSLIKKTFENRGISDPEKYMTDINAANHDSFKDIDILCTHLRDIYINHKHVVVLPDFDMDGIMSGVIGFAGLSALGFSVSLFIPNPSDGYEFTADTIKRLISEYPDVNVILTCDVGISCIDGINYAVSQGIDVIVTDHHVQTLDMFNNTKASVVIDPMRYDETYEHAQICGAYVLQQCLQEYADRYCSIVECEQIRRLRVFAGIGTVSDSMPLRYENRTLVRDAVSICRLFFTGGMNFIYDAIQGDPVYCKAFCGLVTTLQLFKNMKVISSVDDITESFFGYYLAPMFNSVKRLSGDMTKAFGVFFGFMPYYDANYLYELNLERKRLVADEFEKILESNQPYAPYIYISDANAGILGLLATKLMNINHVPTVVVNKHNSGYNGTGRSPEWYAFLSNVTPNGFDIAGHEYAFGISISDDVKLQELYILLDSVTQDVISNSPDVISSNSDVDFVIALDGSGDVGIDLFLFAEYLQELEWYRPFGADFPEPRIMIRFNAHDGNWVTMGNAKQHLKIQLPYGFEVLCFNQAEYINKAYTDDELYVIGHLASNEFMGKFSVNFVGAFTEVN